MLTKQKVKLSDLLAETEIVIHHQKFINEEVQSKNSLSRIKQDNEIITNGDDSFEKYSASRLVLLISTITILTSGTCITSYFFYMIIYIPHGANKMN